MRVEAKIEPKGGLGTTAPPSGSKKESTSPNKKSRLLERKKKAIKKTTTEEFVDDPDLYFSRLSSHFRVNYWEHIVKVRRRFNKPPSGHKSWVQRERDEADKVGKFPWQPVRALQFIVSKTWDYLYFVFFIIFLAVVVVQQQNLAPAFIAGNLKSVWQIMLLLMCLCQLVPSLGSLFYVHRYNDVMHQLAQKQDFGEWAFTSVLIAQYIEHYYYSGKGRSHKAGRWFPLEDPLSPELDDDNPTERGFLASIIFRMKSMFKKPVEHTVSNNINNGDGDIILGAVDLEAGGGMDGASAMTPAAGLPAANGGKDTNNALAISMKQGDARMNNNISSMAASESARREQIGGGGVSTGESGKPPLPGPGDRNLHPEVSELSMQDHASVMTTNDRAPSRFRGGLFGAISGKYKQQQKGAQSDMSVKTYSVAGTAVSGKGKLSQFFSFSAFPKDAKIHPNEDEEKDEEKGDDDNSSLATKNQTIKKLRSNLPEVKEDDEEEELDSLKSEYEDEMEDDQEWNAEIPGQGASYLASIMAQRKAEEEERKRKEKEAKAAKIAAITEWVEFQCLVCGKNNKVPKVMKPEANLYFEKLGVYYQRNVAVMRITRDVPRCDKCFQYRDYKPNIATRHLFPYHPDRYNTFLKYPLKANVQSNLSTNKFVRFIGWLTTCMFGVKDSPSSRLAVKDWRLQWFINSQFPDIPRGEKLPDEWYQVGELVECRLQRSDWTLARIISVRRNRTYDIRYDRGDELRLVEESSLRLPPHKTNDVMQMELGACVIVITFPLFMLLTLQDTSSATSSQGCPLFVGVLIVAVLLLALRMLRLCMYFHQYYDAGFLMVLRLSALSILPLFLTIIASAPTIVLYGGYRGLAAVWILNKIVCLPYLYIMKPGFALLAAPLFFQTSIGFILISLYLDNMFIGIEIPPFATIAPIFTATVTLMYYRKILGKVWNVCIVSRPYEERGALGLKHDAKEQFYRFVKAELRKLRGKEEP